MTPRPPPGSPLACGTPGCRATALATVGSARLLVASTGADRLAAPGAGAAAAASAAGLVGATGISPPGGSCGTAGPRLAGLADVLQRLGLEAKPVPLVTRQHAGRAGRNIQGGIQVIRRRVGLDRVLE